MTTITLPRATVEQTLEALEWISDCHVGDDDDAGECASCHERSYKPHAPDCKKNNAITALRAALAQQDEPVQDHVPGVRKMVEPVEHEALRLAGLSLIGLAEHDPHCEVFDLDDEGRHKACTCGLNDAIVVITQAGKSAPPQQAEPAQEPAFHGFMSDDGTQVDLCFTPNSPRSDGTYATAYYTAPPHRVAQQAEPVEPVDVGLLEYRGNSVAFIHQKMTAYRAGIDAAWDAFRAKGLHPDGKTPLANMIAKYTAPPQRKPLTEEEIESCRQQGYAHAGLGAPFDFGKAARAVERAHGIKE